MSDIWLITGGGRSGKTGYAESLVSDKALAAGDGIAGQSGVLYIATSEATDEEMEERIARHRAARPKDWYTWEKHRDFSDIDNEFDSDNFGTIILDCVGNLLMGILYEDIADADNFKSSEFEKVEQTAISEIDALCAYAARHGKRLIFVTNEIGMGLIPGTRYSRYFRDALGRINKYIAKIADRAVLMVAGIPISLK